MPHGVLGTGGWAASPRDDRKNIDPYAPAHGRTLSRAGAKTIG
jgi:hypothetical protein